MSLLTQQSTDERLMLARLNFAHMQQSIERAMWDEDFARIMCDPFKNPSPSLADLAPNRTIN